MLLMVLGVERRGGDISGVPFREAIGSNACPSLRSYSISNHMTVIYKHLFLGYWGLVTSQQGTKLQFELPLSSPHCPCLGGMKV